MRTAAQIALLFVSDVGGALLVAALLLVPGLLPAWALVRRLRQGDWPTALVAAAAVNVAAVAVASTVGYYAGLGLDWSTALYIALLVGASALAWRMRGAGGLDPAWQGLVVGGVVAGVAAIEGTLLWYTADVFFHMAAVRSLLAQNRPLVTDALYGTATRVLDPVSGSWQTMVAMWCKVTGLDVTLLVPWMGIVFAAVTALAVWALLRSVSKSATAATIATAAWVLIGLYAEFRAAVVPNQASLAFVFLAFTMLVDSAGKPRWSAAILGATAGLAAASMHLASAQVLLVGAAFMVLFALVQYAVDRIRKRPASLAGPGALAGVAAAIVVLAAPVVLPRAQVATSAMSSTVSEFAYYSGSLWKLPLGLFVADPTSLTGYAPLVFVLGAVLGALMLVLALREDDSAAVAGAALALLPVLLLFDPPVTTLMFKYSSYMAARLAAVLRFAPFVALAWGLGRAGRWSAPRIAGYALLAALVAFGVMPTLSTFAEVGSARRGFRFPVGVTRRYDIRRLWGSDAIAQLRAIAGTAYPRAAGAPDTSYYLAGIAPFSVVAVPHSHSPWSIEGVSGKQRRDDMALLLDPTTSEAERRSILARWDASYVVLALDDKAQQAAYAALVNEPGLFKPVLSSPRVVLLRVLR